MATKTTPAKTVTVCDVCGREATCDNSLTWNVVHRDFQGGIVAGNEYRRDLCSDCAPVVHKALNDIGERKGKPDESAIPHDAVCIFKDGNQWCAVFGDFVNLQESVAGFGPTFNDAIDDLNNNFQVEKIAALNARNNEKE